MANNPIYQAMKTYRAAYTKHSDLMFEHDALVAKQRELMPEITKAEADMNKAREAMITAIQTNDAAKS